jgi:hypothetical protein
MWTSDCFDPLKSIKSVPDTSHPLTSAALSIAHEKSQKLNDWRRDNPVNRYFSLARRAYAFFGAFNSSVCISALG